MAGEESMYIIIIGCGRLGNSLASDLSDFGHDVCIIDRDGGRLDALGSGFNGQRIKGIEFDSDKLTEGGIQQADALLAVTSDDNINITISMIADKIYHVPLVVARVNDPSRKYIYDKLNIETINPVRLGAELLINRLNVKNCDVISQLDSDYEMISFMVDKQNPTNVISEIEKKYSCIISGIDRNAKVSLPKQEEKVQHGDRIFCTIHKKDMAKLLRTFSKEIPVWNP